MALDKKLDYLKLLVELRNAGPSNEINERITKICNSIEEEIKEYETNSKDYSF